MIVRLVIQVVYWMVLTGLLLFGSAGTLRWPGGWVYLAESQLGGLAIGLWMARYNIVLEECTLRAELQGDKTYAAEVRCRLVPHIW
ncbi:MAG: hypothetical protein ACLP7Q_15845 [Isosphaeraceae bacterium]